MAKTERGQIANQILPLLGDTTFLLSPTVVKQGAIQWFFGGPGISVVSDSDVEDAETGVIVYGEEFGATQGTGKVELGDSPVYASANKVLQTVTAWTDSQITITVNLGAQSPGEKYFFVTDGNGLLSKPKSCAVHRATAIKLKTSANIGAGGTDATTARLTAPTGSFVAGNRTDDTNPTGTISLTSGAYTEEELSFTVATGAINGQSYEFRLVQTMDDGSKVPLDSYAQTPQITISSGAISGSVTASFAPVMRVTGTKIQTSGSTRALVLVTSRNTVTKIATSGAVRALATVTNQSTGVKIAGGSSRFAETIVGKFTGATVSSVVNGSFLASVPVVARIAGAKISTNGNVTASVPIVERITAGKIYNTGAVTMSVPVVSRNTGIKIGLLFSRFALSITNRNTGVKTTAGSSTFSLPITSRSTGTKTTAGGSSRFLTNISTLTTGSKLATSGASRILETITVSATGSSSNAIQGLSKFLVAITARASGSKITTNGSIKFTEPVTIRTTASKTATGTATLSVPVTSRNTGTKLTIAGSARFISTQAVRSTGSKTTTSGSVRAYVPVVGRFSPGKLISGSVRFYTSIWFSVVKHIGTSPIAKYSIIALSRTRHITFVRKSRTHTHIYNDRHIEYDASKNSMHD